MLKKTVDVARSLRDDIRKYEKKTEVSFTFNANSEVNAVPKRLLSFLALLLEGDASKINRGVLTTAQIALYNFRSKKEYGDPSDTRRHVYSNPLV